jgi:hypothetical protein
VDWDGLRNRHGTPQRGHRRSAAAWVLIG